MRSPEDSYLSQIAEIFSTGDVDEVVRVFAPDYVDPQRPAGMDLAGRAEFVAIVKGAPTSLPNLHVSLAGECIRHDDLEVAVMHWSGRAADGYLIDRYTVETVRIEGGHIAEHWGMEVRTSTTWPTGGEQNGRAHVVGARRTSSYCVVPHTVPPRDTGTVVS